MKGLGMNINKRHMILTAYLVETGCCVSQGSPSTFPAPSHASFISLSLVLNGSESVLLLFVLDCDLHL